MTEILDEAGKTPVWNEEFVLDMVDKEVKADGSFILNTFDSDGPGMDEFLGATRPIKYTELIKSSELKKFNEVELVSSKGKKTGTITFETQYVWAEPPEPESDFENLPPKLLRNVTEQPLNRRCKLVVTIVDASFLKDADFIGKQDPFVAFKYRGMEIKTTVKDNAGKYAQWNEKFDLNYIEKAIFKGEDLILSAYDKDPVGADWLGAIKPMSLKSLSEYQGRVKHSVDILDKKGKKAGHIKFKTEFVWAQYIKPIPDPQMDKKSLLKIIIEEAHFLKDDADTFGK